jgi:hypothetical protein
MVNNLDSNMIVIDMGGGQTVTVVNGDYTLLGQMQMTANIGKSRL